MDNEEQKLFNNFGHAVMNEEVSRILQCKEEILYLSNHDDPDFPTIEFWVNEVTKLQGRMVNMLNDYENNKWDSLLETFVNRNESNYTTLGFFAKMYYFMFNEKLPFDKD